MLILICCVVLVLLGIIGYKYGDPSKDLLELLGAASLITGLFGLLIIVTTVPINHIDVQSEIHQVEALQQTVQNARENNVILEKAAIQRSIADKNEWIASIQYWNTTVFDIWIPDEVEKLELIE